MKRYKVSVDGGEYKKDNQSELPLVVRECIEKLIESGNDTGTIDIPGFRCAYSITPEQCFPEDMMDNVHRICCELRTMSETLDGIDSEKFRQTIVTIKECSSVLTSAMKREHNRNEVINGNQIKLREQAKKNRDVVNQLCSTDENTGLCPYHQKNASGFHHYLNSDCPVCKREMDRYSVE